MSRLPNCKPAATSAAIIRAATDIFLAEGFEAASMDAIARRADVSKATLYAHFANKEALFTAVMHEQRTGYQQQLDELAADQHGDFAERLTKVGISLVTFLLSPTKLQMFRVMMTESERIPEICQNFVKAGREYSYQRIAGIFQDGIVSGQLVEHDPREAARLFVAALRGDLVWTALLERHHVPSPAEIDARVAAVVQPLVKLYRDPNLDKPAT